MAVPSPNVLLALFIISFSLSAIFHRSSHHNDTSPPSVFSHFAADISIPSTNDTFSSRPAAFGSEFPEHLGGRLVKAWGDGLACSDVASGADQRLATEYEGMIVLVQRGLCSFAEKVRRVQHAGGIAAIVGDNTAGSGLLTMYAKGILLRVCRANDEGTPEISSFRPHLFLIQLIYPSHSSSPFRLL